MTCVSAKYNPSTENIADTIEAHCRPERGSRAQLAFPAAQTYTLQRLPSRIHKLKVIITVRAPSKNRLLNAKLSF